MTNPTNPQDLCERIEHLVEEYISSTRAAAQAAVERAFATAAAADARRPREGGPAVRSRLGVRRASDEIGVLSERLYHYCGIPPSVAMVRMLLGQHVVGGPWLD
jgi:hypothetical protein